MKIGLAKINSAASSRKLEDFFNKDMNLKAAAESPNLKSANLNSAAADNQEDKKLRKACAQFESVLMGFMLKAMRKTVNKTDLFGSSKEEELFQDMMDTQICEAASRNNSVGIADMLYRELRPLAKDSSGSLKNQSQGGTK